MRIGLIGTHGGGKTTVFTELRLRRPDVAFFSSAVRHQLPAFGLGHLFRDVCPTYGIGAFQLFNMNAWSVIDPAVNTRLAPEDHVITDRSVIDSTAYFLAMRKTPTDHLVEPLVLAMLQYYASLYDLFVYFPCGKFPLVGDVARPADTAFQERIDQSVWLVIKMLRLVEQQRLHVLQVVDVHERVEEILRLLPVP